MQLATGSLVRRTTSGLPTSDVNATSRCRAGQGMKLPSRIHPTGLLTSSAKT
jgi:hypothetical protein